MLRLLQLCYLFTVSVLLCLNGSLAIQHRLVLTNTTTVMNPNLGNLTFTVTDTTVSYSCHIFYNIENAIIKADLNVKYTDYGPYTNFFKKNLNFCEFMANPNIDPLFYLGYKTATKYQHNKIFTKCPIKAGKYYVKDFPLDITDVPIPVHNLKFNTMIEFLITNTNQSIIMYVEGRIQTSSKRPIGKSSRKRG